MRKWVYKFHEGNADMRELLGGKGANLAEMTNLGMPIPQGFTITTHARIIMQMRSKSAEKSRHRFLKRWAGWSR